MCGAEPDSNPGVAGPRALTPGGPTGSPGAVTFVGSLESQGAAAAIRLEEEPHLMVGADNEVWDRRTCQAVRERDLEVRISPRHPNRMVPGQRCLKECAGAGPTCAD